MSLEMTSVIALVRNNVMVKALAAENMETAVERMRNHLLIDYREQKHVINSDFAAFLDNNGLELYAEYTDHDNPLSIRWVGILEYGDDFTMFGAATETEQWNYIDYFLHEAWEDSDTKFSPQENMSRLEQETGENILKIHAV